jgi:hypothetical protein
VALTRQEVQTLAEVEGEVASQVEEQQVQRVQRVQQVLRMRMDQVVQEVGEHCLQVNQVVGVEAEQDSKYSQRITHLHSQYKKDPKVLVLLLPQLKCITYISFSECRYKVIGRAQPFVRVMRSISLNPFNHIYLASNS